MTACTDTLQASAIGWTLYKIAQMESLQQELRNEIQSASGNGLDDLDYDNMPFLNAMINVRSTSANRCQLMLEFRVGGSPFVCTLPSGRTRGDRGLCSSSQPPSRHHHWETNFRNSYQEGAAYLCCHLRLSQVRIREQI